MFEVPPSPKDHVHDVGEYVEESTNWTVSGAVPDVVVETKELTGAVAAEGNTRVSESVVMKRRPRNRDLMVHLHP